MMVASSQKLTMDSRMKSWEGALVLPVIRVKMQLRKVVEKPKPNLSSLVLGKKLSQL